MRTTSARSTSSPAMTNHNVQKSDSEWRAVLSPEIAAVAELPVATLVVVILTGCTPARVQASASNVGDKTFALADGGVIHPGLTGKAK